MNIFCNFLVFFSRFQFLETFQLEVLHFRPFSKLIVYLFAHDDLDCNCWLATINKKSVCSSFSFVYLEHFSQFSLPLLQVVAVEDNGIVAAAAPSTSLPIPGAAVAIDVCFFGLEAKKQLVLNALQRIVNVDLKGEIIMD